MDGKLMDKIILGVIVLVVLFALFPTVVNSGADLKSNPNVTAAQGAMIDIAPLLLIVGAVLAFVYSVTRK